MKNYVQMGNTLTLTAAAAIVSGAPLLMGSLFGIASTDAEIGDQVEMALAGVYTLTKKSADTPAAFAKAYWDDTAKEVTTTASGNSLVGVFTEAVAGGVTSAAVRLNGVSI